MHCIPLGEEGMKGAGPAREAAMKWAQGSGVELGAIYDTKALAPASAPVKAVGAEQKSSSRHARSSPLNQVVLPFLTHYTAFSGYTHV